MKKKKEEKKLGILENIREVNREERRQREEREKKEIKKHDIQREEYAKSLAEEKIELLRLKQGMIEESDVIKAEQAEKKHYTIWQRLGNFIYHNKWWLGLALVFVIIASFLIYDLATRKEYDATFLILCDDAKIDECQERIEEYLKSKTDDYNFDGKNLVNVQYIPIAADEGEKEAGSYETNLDRLSNQFMFGEGMIVIADKNSDEFIEPEETFIDLEELYPDNENVKGCRFYLKNTDFGKRIGYNGELPEDVYIGIRTLESSSISKNKMQGYYDRALEIFDMLIKDVSKQYQ